MRYLSIAILTLLAFVVITLPVHAQDAEVNVNFPGSNLVKQGDPVAIVANFYEFALMFAGMLAFGTIVYGAIKRVTSVGNPSAISEANEWITSALLGLLLLLGAYIVLYTINPELIMLKLPRLEKIKGVPPATEGTICDNQETLAGKYGTAFPYKNAPDLTQLIQCIESKIPRSELGSKFTWDIDHATCNYTRGLAVCDPNSRCSHARNSCHYGGSSGSQGALAVDYGNETIGGKIVVVAQQCGAKSARCENAAGRNVGVSGTSCGAGATHVHINAASCDSN